MRTRSRTGIWNRRWRGNQHIMPTSYTSLKYNNVWYYPPWISLAEYHKTSRAINTASATTYNDGETITDVGMSKREYEAALEKGQIPWNYVQHTKRRCGTFPWTAVSTRSTSRYVDGWEGRCPLPFSSVPAAPVLTPYQAMQLYGECYNDLIPQFESDVSLANFILELKDFKGLVKQVPRATRRLMRTMYDKGYYKDIRWSHPRRGVPRNQGPDLADHLRHSDRRLRKEKGFYMLDTMSSLDLNYHYAIRPFFQDVVNIFDMWANLDGAVKRLNSQGSVRNVRHGRRDANLATSASGTTQYRQITAKRNTYALTAEMTYRLRPTNKLDQFMAYSGLRMNPKKIWDALPFSFVLDHFCNVGEALGSFDTSEVDFQMTRLLESATSESGAFEALHPTYHVYSHFSGSDLPAQAQQLWDAAAYAGSGYMPTTWTMISSYERKLIEPIPYVRPPILPKLQVPSMDAIRLDLDLLYQLFYNGRTSPSWRQG